MLTVCICYSDFRSFCNCYAVPWHNSQLWQVKCLKTAAQQKMDLRSSSRFQKDVTKHQKDSSYHDLFNKKKSSITKTMKPDALHTFLPIVHMFPFLPFGFYFLIAVCTWMLFQLILCYQVRFFLCLANCQMLHIIWMGFLWGSWGLTMPTSITTRIFIPVNMEIFRYKDMGSFETHVQENLWKLMSRSKDYWSSELISGKVVLKFD